MKINFSKSKFLENLPIIIFFTTIGLIFTYPLIFKFSSAIYGYPGDPTGTIWMFWWQKKAFLSRIDPNIIPIVGAPFGLDISAWPASPVIMNTALIASILVNETFAYNILTFLTFPIAGLTMYYLVKYFTDNKAASIISGVIYSISPYHLAHSYGHLGIIMGLQWLPLYVLTLFKLHEKRSMKYMILCGAAFALVVLTNYYDGFFMLVFTAVFIAFGLLWTIFKNKQASINLKALGYYICAFLVSIAIIIPFSLHIFKTSTSAPKTYARNIGELFTYSARPWEYLLPAIDHPLFGQYVAPFLSSHMHGSNAVEQTIYLGYVPMILALLALVLYKKSKNNEINMNDFAFVITFFILAAFVAFLFSVPPILEIGSISVPMPSYFTFKFASMFRAYARFGNIVLLCVAVLAGIGVSFLFKKISRLKYVAATTVLVILLITVEFTNIPPLRVTDLSATPPAYKWLFKQKGAFTIAEYPLFGNNEAPHYDYVFYQRIHEKKLLNGTAFGSESDNLRLKLTNITDPRVPQILKFLKIKYIIINLRKYPQEQLQSLKSLPDLRLVKKFRDQEIYKVSPDIKPLKIRLPTHVLRRIDK